MTGETRPKVVRRWREALRRLAIRALPLPTRLGLFRVLRRLHLWPRPVGPLAETANAIPSDPTRPRTAAHPVVLWLAANPWNCDSDTSECLAPQIARTLWPVWIVAPAPTIAFPPRSAEPVPNIHCLEIAGSGPGAFGPSRPVEAESADFAAAVVARLDAEEPGAGAVVCESRRWLPIATRIHDALDWPMITAPVPGEVVGSPLPETHQERAQTLTAAIREFFPPVSIAVVTFNNLALTELCLDSLLFETGYPDLDVIVVDNASTDGTREWLEGFVHAHPVVRLIANQTNVGFAAANNQAIAAARESYFCFLNNDTVLSRNWLQPLISALRRDPTLGLVGPVTNGAGNEARIEIGYQDVGAMAGWARNWVRAHRGETFDLDMLGLYCAVTRRDVIDRVGLLDERFQIGFFEDDDWCRRLRRAGYSIRCRKDSFVHHWQGATFALLGERRLGEIYEENRNLYRRKWSRRAKA